MRLTLHLIPAADFAVYIEAMRPASRAVLARWQRRLKITAAHVRIMIDTVLDALDAGALPQQELVARAKRRAPKGMRAWLDHAWSAVRPAVIEGAIVYGPPRGAEATFVRVDRWLGAQPLLTVETARAELLRRFVRGFGPATAHDFAKWSGHQRQREPSRGRRARAGAHARVGRRRCGLDPVGGRRHADAPDTRRRRRSLARPIRFISPRSCNRRTPRRCEVLQARVPCTGRISAVVLRGTTIVGTWTQTTEGRRTTVAVELFRREPAAVRRAIEDEIAALSAFLGAPATMRVVSI